MARYRIEYVSNDVNREVVIEGDNPQHATNKLYNQDTVDCVLGFYDITQGEDVDVLDQTA